MPRHHPRHAPHAPRSPRPQPRPPLTAAEHALSAEVSRELAALVQAQEAYVAGQLPAPSTPFRVVSSGHAPQLVEAVPLNVAQTYRADGHYLLVFTRLLRTGQDAEVHDCADLATAQQVLRTYDPTTGLPFLSAAERQQVRHRYLQRLPRLLERCAGLLAETVRLNPGWQPPRHRGAPR